MNTVCDDAKIRFWSGNGRWWCAEKAEDAWVTVVKRFHGVEEMCYHGGTGMYAGDGFFVSCFRVPDRDDDSKIAEGGDGG